MRAVWLKEDLADTFAFGELGLQPCQKRLRGDGQFAVEGDGGGGGVVAGLRVAG